MTSAAGYSTYLYATSGTLNNGGLIDIQTGAGGLRTLGANLTNNDRVRINANTTFSKASGLYTNNADFNIAGAKTLTITGSNQRFVQNAGTLSIDGALNISSMTFDFDGGALTGNAPTITSSNLNIGPGSVGSAQFNLQGISNLSGDIAPAQIVNINANGATASITAATGFTNSGTINMTAPTGHTAILYVTAGTLLNESLIDIQPGAGGARTLAANLTNNDRVMINTDTTFSKASGLYTNNADFDIAAARTLTIAGSSQKFIQNAGTLDINGALKISSAQFDFDGGSLTGNAPTLTNSTFNIGPGSVGAGEFNLHGVCSLSGDIAPAQIVNINANGATASITAATGFTNNGTINMTAPTGHTAILYVTAGTLINESLIDIQPGAGGARTLVANLTNNDRVRINTDTTFSKGSGVYTNNADFDIAAARTLTIAGSSQKFVQNAGTLDINGALSISSARFDFDGGLLTGNAPTLTNSSLNIGPGSVGAGEFNLHGVCSLSGDIAPAQIVNINANGATASTTAATGFTNNGAINMTAPTGHPAYLYVTTGTLVNESLIDIQPSAGGARTLVGHLTNNDRVKINTNTTFSKASGLYTNNANFDIAASRTLTITGSGQKFLQNAGTLDIAGAIRITSAAFDFDGGTVTGNPADIASGSLNIGAGSTGAGEFNLFGTSSLSGDIAAAQSVYINGSGATASTTAAIGFTNDGTMTLFSSSGHPAYLYITTGTLVNDGLFDVQAGAGGPRLLSAPLDNGGTFEAHASVTLGKTGADHVNSGQFDIPVGAAVVNVRGLSFTNAPDGTISGIGELDVSLIGSGLLLNQGSVEPGDSPGILTVDGDYDQTSTGELVIEIAGTTAGGQYDRLVVTGDATLAGELTVLLDGSFTPAPTDEFIIMTGASITDRFANADTAVPVSGRGWFDVTYTSTDVRLTNFQVPEPTSMIALLLGAGALLRRRR